MLDAAAGQAGSAGQMEAQPGVRLQRVILDRPAPLRDLYWRVRGDARLEAGNLRIEPGASVAFDTYFNALFEHHWRLHTRATSFTLQVEIAGRAKLHLWRMTQHGGQTLLQEAEVDGAAELHLADDTPNFRQAGMVWFELTAVAGPAILHRAEWFAADAAPEPVGLAATLFTLQSEWRL
jgi:galactofuranosylgalactofuranosylrhamnosyl-N-acetylglucosaminyl-diphospho-decaprenol beta-1,5/1,6-galactofuranosyltransferase